MATQKYSAEQVADALRRTEGLVYMAAQLLCCTPKTVYHYLDRYPTVRQAREDATELSLDISELKLFEQRNAGNISAIKYHLSTKGKHRGYTDSADKLADALGELGQGISRLLDYGNDSDDSE